MGDYKIIIDKDNIVLKKKENKFKLEAKKHVVLPCKIIEHVESLEIYNLFKLLNDKLITKCKIMKDKQESNPDVLLCLKNFLENEDSDEDFNEPSDSFYITFTNNIKKINDKTMVIEGKKNNVSIDKDGWKKVEIDDILLNFELNNDELIIKLKFTYIGNKMPIYAENTIGLIFTKIVKNLLIYYSK